MIGSVNVPGASAADLALVKKTADEAKKTAAAAMETVQKYTMTITTVPSQAGSLSYTGNAQSPSWNDYNTDQLTIGGTTSATDAGTYAATFTPKGDYVWADGTKGPVTVNWTIERAAINNTPSQSGTLAYTGAAQTPAWSNYNTDQLTIGGTTSTTNAGTYAATFTPTANYKWADGTTAARTVNWSIGRAAISAAPAQSGTLTYTGNAQTPAWSNYAAARLTIGGTTSATNAGTYAATFTPTANYQWSDGTTGAKSVNWSIGRAAGSLALDKTALTLNSAAKTEFITVTRPGDGVITATSSDTSVATVSVSGAVVTVIGVAYGSAIITVKVAAGTNHTAPASKTCAVQANVFNATLNSNTWAAIKAASDAGEAASNWSVGDTKTVTINGTAGKTTISNLSVDTFIIGFNHNALFEGDNATHFQIGKINGNLVGLVSSFYGSSTESERYFNMNPSGSNSGGWSSCAMRTAILGSNANPTNPTADTLLAALPSDLRAVMKPMTKYSDNTGRGTNGAQYVTATTDYLPLLSEYEYHGTQTYANATEQQYQEQYVYYGAGNSRKHRKYSDPTVAVSVSCRSVYAGNSLCFCAVDDLGAAGNARADTCLAVSPIFAV